MVQIPTLSSFLLAENSIIDRQRERYEDALEQADEFLVRYDGSTRRKEVRDIKLISEKKLKSL